MSVKIIDVEKNSHAEKRGIKSGMVLCKINGNNITDVLDYRFYETEPHLILELISDQERLNIEIKKSQYSPLGLIFDTYLMDKERACKNKCIFCFIDQLPKGMRKSLYFKDDDNRLSFLFGNYITLTNIDDEEIDRIIKLRISPINVSVHTMNPSLRVKMMNNHFAGESLKFLKKLADSGIALNCQLVLCPDVNDGDELEYSLKALKGLGNSLQSVACVPVGLSGHRDGLYPLKPYDQIAAARTIAIIEDYGEKELRDSGNRKFYPSDEFYIIANRELPNFEFYEDFPQIENGVGMLRNLEEEVLYALEDGVEKVFTQKVNMVTGMAVYPFMLSLLDEIKRKWDNVDVSLFPIKNVFFGGSVDVTGLLTGSDIIRAFEGVVLTGKLLIPDVCLKADMDVFLDDISLEELSKRLNIKVEKIGSTGQELVDAVINVKG